MTNKVYEIKLNNCKTKNKHKTSDSKRGFSWCNICGKLFNNTRYFK